VISFSIFGSIADSYWITLIGEPKIICYISTCSMVEGSILVATLGLVRPDIVSEYLCWIMNYRLKSVTTKRRKS